MKTINSKVITKYFAAAGIPKNALGNSPVQGNFSALYSFADVGQIIGLTHEAVRKRAIIDQWPCVEIFIRAGRVRRPHFVPGEFLANLQLNGDLENE